MILSVPITGKLVSYDPETKVGKGSDTDPIRPLDFNKFLPEGSGHFEWEAVLYEYGRCPLQVREAYDRD